MANAGGGGAVGVLCSRVGALTAIGVFCCSTTLHAPKPPPGRPVAPAALATRHSHSPASRSPVRTSAGAGVVRHAVGNDLHTRCGGR